MNFKKIFGAGIIAGIVAIIIGMTLGMLTGNMYDAASPLWKPMTGNFYMYMALFNIVVWTIFAAVYSVLSGSVPGAGYMRGVNYGLLVWLVGTVPGMMITYLTMAVPTVLIGVWLFSNLVTYAIAGAVLATMYEKF